MAFWGEVIIRASRQGPASAAHPHTKSAFVLGVALPCGEIASTPSGKALVSVSQLVKCPKRVSVAVALCVCRIMSQVANVGTLQRENHALRSTKMRCGGRRKSGKIISSKC